MDQTVSVVIPTYNEEKYLPGLLSSLQTQTFKPLEIIVADNRSTDRTCAIAKQYGCRIVQGGLPSKGRNSGALVAKGDLFLFFDADVVLPPNFVKEFITKFQTQKLDIASCYFLPLSDRKVDKFLHWNFNKSIKLLEKMSPILPGFCTLITRELHRKVGGYDESIVLAEDTDYVRRVVKHGKYSHLKEPTFFVSVRRFDKDGRVNVISKYIAAMFYIAMIGNIRTDLFKYRFGYKN